MERNHDLTGPEPRHDQVAYSHVDATVGGANATESASGASDDPGSGTVCVVGLGYVGLPLAVAFDGPDRDVIGYDVDADRIDRLDAGEDPTGDVGDDTLADSSVEFTATPDPIGAADYVVVTVPTPVDDGNDPNLEFVESAGEAVGANLTPGTTVVLESTVFPGATEDVLVPALEAESGLDAGEEFHVAYSPERASPGDEGRGVSDVVKIVGADTEPVREDVATLYENGVDAEVYRAPSIETAEAAKVIENVQRDINIALVNELAIACDHMGLSTREVLDAASTKWNFHDEYTPGLVGGHCIPVDPHYLAHRSERDGFSPTLVLEAREINDFVPTHVTDLAVKALNEAGKVLRESRLLVLGLAYKPNVGDIRTSEISGVVEGLQEYGVDLVGFDPHADDDAMAEAFDLPIQSSLDPRGFDGAIVATGHDEFDALDLDALAAAMNDDPVLVDVDGTFHVDAPGDHGFVHRRL